MDRPDKRGREQILQIHARNVKLGPDVDLKAIAARTPGFAGADLANVVNEAALLAARRNKNAVTRADFEEAIERVVAGLEKKSRRINEREKEIVAFHESGHALVSWMLPARRAGSPRSPSSRAAWRRSATRCSCPSRTGTSVTRSELRDRMAGLMGGRVAEEEVFGELVHRRLQRPAAGHRDSPGMMVRDYGMSPALGPVALGDQGGPNFLGIKGMEPRIYSEQTALEVDREVQSLVVEAQERARELVRRHRDKLDAIAARLLTTEVIEEEEITRLWGPKASRPGTVEGPGHTESPPENPNRPVAVSERRAFVIPQARTAVHDGGDHGE